MRKVNGYVFVVQLKGTHYKPMFGKKEEERSNGNYANMGGNGLIPYDSVEQAVEGAEDFKQKRKGVEEIKIGKLEMEIAESVEEFEEFREKDSLVVIKREVEENYIDESFLGPIVEGKPDFYPLPGAFLENNGYKPFYSKEWAGSAYQRVLYLAGEIARQCQCGGVLATFHLEIIQ